MLPRTESIFHLGEEEGGEAPESAAAITELDCSKYEGLRILIQRSGRPSNYVVIKSLLKPFTPMASPPRFGFLRACCFCKRELSLHKDVYMYRGEQGFCSEECRRRQILQDERSELGASTRERERSKAPLPHHASTGVDDAGRRRRISAVA